MVWEVLENNTVSNLLEKIYDSKDSGLKYIQNKVKRRGIEYLTLSEYNYIREKNKLKKISITNIDKLLWDNLLTYTDIFNITQISRPMLSMILRETRNTTIVALQKITTCISMKNPKVDKELIME